MLGVSHTTGAAQQAPAGAGPEAGSSRHDAIARWSESPMATYVPRVALCGGTDSKTAQSAIHMCTTRERETQTNNLTSVARSAQAHSGAFFASVHTYACAKRLKPGSKRSLQGLHPPQNVREITIENAQSKNERVFQKIRQGVSRGKVRGALWHARPAHNLRRSLH